jgi:uncharacterized protein (DUF302 family)
MEAEGDFVTRSSPYGFGETVTRLTGLLDARGLKLFDVIDQRAEAESVGLELRPTTLVLFGNPTAGTPLMEAAPLAALDLPLKVLIWAAEGTTWVAYQDPAALAQRHGLDDLVGNIAGVVALVEALVAPAGD